MDESGGHYLAGIADRPVTAFHFPGDERPPGTRRSMLRLTGRLAAGNGLTMAKIIDKLAHARSDQEVIVGLRLVLDKWLAFVAANPMPPEDEIVGYVAPFIAPTVSELAGHPSWAGKSEADRIDLVFVLLLAQVKTETGKTKLRAMRDFLRED